MVTITLDGSKKIEIPIRRWVLGLCRFRIQSVCDHAKNICHVQV
jgi:hypothetical protein